MSDDVMRKLKNNELTCVADLRIESDERFRHSLRRLASDAAERLVSARSARTVSHMNSKESPADFPAGLLPGETLMKNPMYVRAGIAGNRFVRTA